MLEIFLTLFVISFSFISPIIIFPFQTYNPLITNNPILLELIKKTSDKEIINTISRNLIYINFYLGEDKQIIPAFIEMGSNEFYFNDMAIHNEKSINREIANLNFTFNDNYLFKNYYKLNYYNSSLSKSYKFITTCPEYLQEFFMDEDVCANETIYLEYKINITDKPINKPFTFYITFKEFTKLDQRTGIIGLHIDNSDFILKLKKNSGIKNYNWNIKYTDSLEEKGEIIFGDLPHKYDTHNYNEDNLMNAKIVKDSKIEWSICFDEVYITKINSMNNEIFYLEKNEIGAFYIEEFFTLATNEYLEEIENIFFKKYINEGICQKQRHNKINNYNSYFHFMCYIKDNKKREEFFNNFPTLTFFQKEMNYNFTFDWKDLFTIIPDNNRILFNIEFNYGSKKWIFGKTFFKKYQLNFNSDTKLISYYTNNKKEYKNSEKFEYIKNENNKKIIIIFLVIFAFLIGIIFGKALCSKYKRKIRANELEDNFSYISKDKKNINLKNENYINKYQLIQ